MRPIAFIFFAILAPGFAAGEEYRLFDGQSLAYFQHQDGSQPRPRWRVTDGTIHLDSKSGKPGGNIISLGDFCDFRLSFEWKMPPGGNSGIKYRVREYGGQWLGCEYQMTDDEHFQMRPDSKSSSAALYALYGPDPEMKRLRPVGEFNTGQIVVQGSRLEHWLNGEKVVEASVGSIDWMNRVAHSKFRDKPGFSQNRRGRIMLTDHSSDVWMRNIRLEIFPETQYLPTTDCRPVSCQNPVQCR